MQKIIKDEVATNVCSSVGPVHIAREEMPDIARLKDKESDPEYIVSILDTTSERRTYQKMFVMPGLRENGVECNSFWRQIVA